MNHRRREGFTPRECFICGAMMQKEEDVNFLKHDDEDISYPNTDYNGYCKSHTIDDVLQKVGGRYVLKPLFKPVILKHVAMAKVRPSIWSRIKEMFGY